ncbi:MAG: DUF6796 family protein [Fuerstiella sp.]
MNNHTTNPASGLAVFVAGLLGLQGSVLVGAAEFSLHFTPTMDYGGPQYEFFLQTSAQRLTFGHFLAIFAAPLYFAGYWHLFQRLKPAPQKARLLLLGLGIYSFAIGSVWIGSRVYPAILIQAREAAANEAAKEQISCLLETASFYNETILVGLRIGVLALSAVFIWIVSTGRSSYPRWFAAFNPILLVLVSFLIYFVAPSIGGYLMPIAMNVAHFVLFGVSLCLMRSDQVGT